MSEETLQREINILKLEVLRLKEGRFGPSTRISAWNDASPRAIIGQGTTIAEGVGITISKDGQHIQIDGTNLRTWAFFLGGSGGR